MMTELLLSILWAVFWFITGYLAIRYLDGEPYV